MKLNISHRVPIEHLCNITLITYHLFFKTEGKEKFQMNLTDISERLAHPTDWVTEWQTKQLFVPVCIRGNYRHSNNLAFHLFSHITQGAAVRSGRRHCATSAACRISALSCWQHGGMPEFRVRTWKTTAHWSEV